MKQRSMRERLIGHLKREWISPLRALELVQCLSLSQRVGEIEREGHLVNRRWKKLDNGKTVREYKIVSPTSWTA